MTENETIEKLNMLDEALNFQRHDADECSCALQMAIQALEEIQQYRAIGTVEEMQELKGVITDFPLDCGDTVTTVKEILHQLSEYLKIGTIEEFKALKEKAEPKKPTESKMEYDEVLEDNYMLHYCACGNEICRVQRFCECAVRNLIGRKNRRINMAELISKEILLEKMSELSYMGQSIEEIYADFETLINEQPTTTEAEIRAKAIDEFVERLKDKTTFLKLIENPYYGFVSEREINEIAEELKGGAEC